MIDTPVLSDSLLRSVSAGPKRSRVDPIGVERKHPVIKLPRRLALMVEFIEVANVLARRVDVARAVVGIERTVAHDDRGRIYRRDLVDGREPR
jgi:hypothetical protein